jgi:hypothetical protein
MSAARLRAGHVLGALGALVLVAALWLPWYGVTLGDELRSALEEGLPAGGDPFAAFARGMLEVLPRSFSVDAWTAFGAGDIVLLGAGAAIVAVVVLTALDRFDPDAAARGIAALGAGALALVVVKLADQPGPDALVEVRHGAWIAAAGSLLAVLGGLAAARSSQPAPPVPASPLGRTFDGARSVAPPSP